MMNSSVSPFMRVLWIAVASGLLSGVLVVFLMAMVFPTAWFFFIIPAAMGWSIKRFANITHDEVEADENLDKKVGWVSAAIILLFVLLIAGLTILAAVYTHMTASLIFNLPFYIVLGLSVWYGYSRGVQAVMDSYYDSHRSEKESEA